MHTASSILDPIVGGAQAHVALTYKRAPTTLGSRVWIRRIRRTIDSGGTESVHAEERLSDGNESSIMIV